MLFLIYSHQTCKQNPKQRGFIRFKESYEWYDQHVHVFSTNTPSHKKENPPEKAPHNTIHSLYKKYLPKTTSLPFWKKARIHTKIDDKCLKRLTIVYEMESKTKAQAQRQAE